MHNECDRLIEGMQGARSLVTGVRGWDLLFKSGHCEGLLTKVRQHACNAADNSLVELVSARRDTVADPRNLGRIVTVMTRYQVVDRAHHR